MVEKNSKTSLNLDENVEGLLCYVLGWITGIVFLILEKKSRFVKFHALQSLITFAVLMVLAWVFMVIPFIGYIISWIIWVLTIILWIVLMIKAYQHEMFKLPVVGEIAEKSVK